jgi:hypothetical protein
MKQDKKKQIKKRITERGRGGLKHNIYCMDMGQLHVNHGVYTWISQDSQNKELSFPDASARPFFVTETLYTSCEVGTAILSTIYINVTIRMVRKNE